MAGVQNGGWWRSVRKHLNFYRIHVVYFTFTPVIASAIFYASNGRYPVSYVDSLYNCISAMTVCGLTTINLSSLTVWQQAILFFLMCLGSPVVISWAMVYTRRYYFSKKFQHIMEAEAVRKLQRIETRRLSRLEHQNGSKRFIPRLGSRLSTVQPIKSGRPKVQSRSNRKERKALTVARKLTTGMIRRLDSTPQRVDPNGWISEGRTDLEMRAVNSDATDGKLRRSSSKDRSSRTAETDEHHMDRQSYEGGTSSVVVESLFSSPLPKERDFVGLPQSFQTTENQAGPSNIVISPHNAANTEFNRSQTVEFAPQVNIRPVTNINGYHSNSSQPSLGNTSNKPKSESFLPHERASQRLPREGVPLQVTLTNRSYYAKSTGFGGFPMPHVLLGDILKSIFRLLQQRLPQAAPMKRTATALSRRSQTSAATHVPYISFPVVVGRNSVFHSLSNDQLEELGGVEYRALNALLWLVPLYHIGTQLIGFIIIAPYISTSRWASNFVIPQLIRKVAPEWFALFVVVSAYTNTGMSLVDQSFISFQTAYPMIVFTIILVLAGNTAFPVFLRLMIWCIYKIIPKDSRLKETLQFLLDHPRRCFIYLFPSYQTWFLVVVLVILNCIDWFFFLILDIGNPIIDTISLGTRVIDGLLQATAVRASGFSVVELSALSPSVKVLYVLMMYISVYPIAMSVRSTNVYEEQSLGVFARGDESDSEEDFQASGPGVGVISRYLAMHARRQLSFDMWWLGLALFLVCIVERGALNDTANQNWFNIWAIVFELVSAYGSVGLSLGIPTQNYSLSGAFRKLSKLIVCLVMIRGRHRGLPVAIDRAVMLPAEFQTRTRESRTEERDADMNGSAAGLQALRPSSQLPGPIASAVDKTVAAPDLSEQRQRMARRMSSPGTQPDEVLKRTAGQESDR